jgi:DNA-binding PadR family transcriptional regulator
MGDIVPTRRARASGFPDRGLNRPAGARSLTELEGAVLGMIRVMGPCTPYAIRREFRSSTTPYWSASAGAIYPLVERLTRRRLLRAVRATGDGRGGTLYALTAAGERALRRWLGPPLPTTVVGTPPDPLRTRVNFLGALTPAERLAFLTEAAEKLARQLEMVGAAVGATKDPFDRLALRGSYLAMEARLAWVREGLAAAREGLTG